MKKILAGIAALLLIVAVWGGMLLRPQPRTPASPESCISEMYAAMRSGNVAGYLNCFSGDLYRRIAQTAKSEGSRFQANLQFQAKAVRGYTILHHKTRQIGNSEIHLVVDRVYEDRPWEYQTYRLMKRSAGWAIFQIDPAVPHEAPVAYLTPVVPEADAKPEPEPPSERENHD